MGSERQTQPSGPDHTPDAPAPLAAPQAVEVVAAEFAGSAPLRVLSGVPPATPNARPVQRAAVLSLQQWHGNAFTTRVLARNARPISDPATIRRHPEGAGLTIDPEEVKSLPTRLPPRPAADPSGATAAPQPDGSTTTTSTTSTTSTPTSTGSTTSTAASGTSTTTGTGTTPPAPAAPAYMDLNSSQKALTASYGSIKTITPGNIVFLDNDEATWNKYDEVSIRDKIQNPFVTPARAWAKGDAKAQYTAGLRGFADDTTNTSYINKSAAVSTTTCHEMLHLNTAAGFRKTVGETINEGTTQHLAEKAVTAAGVALPANLSYRGETAFVRKLIALVGEETLTQAYFNGPDVLTRTFNLLRPPLWWYFMRGLAEAKNYTLAEVYIQPPTAQIKIDVINDLLDGWVSDKDIEDIRLIFNSNDADKAAIRTAIQPRIKELWSIGQRTRLRVILGTV